MPSPQGVTLRGFSQQAKKDSAILIVEEHVRAPVSSLCNVVRQTRNDNTPESGHFSFPSQGKFGERVGRPFFSPSFFLLPVGAVEGAVLDGFRNMAGLDILVPLEIRNG